MDLLYPELVAHPEAKPLPGGPLVRTAGQSYKAIPGNHIGHEGRDLISGTFRFVIFIPTISHTTHCQLLAVTVPKGIGPGQMIAVLAPDGSREVKATVPGGMKAGDKFLVRLAAPLSSDKMNTRPSNATTAEPNFAHSLDSWLPQSHSSKQHQIETANSSIIDPHGHTPLSSPSSGAHSPIRGHTVYGQVEAAEESRQEPEQQSHQKLLLVHVPSGVPSGSTLQVEVPGEDRTLAAQVPPNVSSFHVAYSPRSSPKATTSSPRLSFSPRSGAQPQPKQKLLLVRVPAGTTPGTTLHVSVPDEPGRILAARVPPGNVSEFHVSYQPRSSPQHGDRRSHHHSRSPEVHHPAPLNSRHQSPHSPIVREAPTTSTGYFTDHRPQY